MEKQSNCGRPAGRKKTSKIEVSIEPEVKEVFMQLLHQDGKQHLLRLGVGLENILKRTWRKYSNECCIII